MLKRIASIVVGIFLGFFITSVTLYWVSHFLPMGAWAAILWGFAIAGGVLGNWTYDRYWNDWYKDSRKDTVPEHWNEPRRSNDMGNEPDD